MESRLKGGTRLKCFFQSRLERTVADFIAAFASVTCFAVELLKLIRPISRQCPLDCKEVKNLNFLLRSNYKSLKITILKPIMKKGG